MKKFALALLLGLSACTTVGVTPSTPPAICATEVIMDEKAMAGLELAYNTTAKLYLNAVNNNIISGEKKDGAKAALQTGASWLLKAREAYKLGNAASFSCAHVASSGWFNSATAIVKGAQ